MNDDKKKELCVRMAKELPLLRKTIGATQEELAALMDISRSTVNNIERNKTMGWNSFLSFLFLFSRHRDAEKLIQAFDLYPQELDDYLTGRNRAAS